MFKLAAGDLGYKIFGLVMWSAAITSVVGCAYTSVSFIRTFSPTLEKYHRYLIIGFILFSSFIFSFIGKPVTVLVVVGALNGLILPIVLGSLLLAAKKEKNRGGLPSFLLSVLYRLAGLCGDAVHESPDHPEDAGLTEGEDFITNLTGWRCVYSIM